MIDKKTGEVLPRKIRNRANWYLHSSPGETNSGISQTIPDQTMAIRTLIERYVRGIPVSTKTPIWEGEDNDLPDPNTMDYAERQEMAFTFAAELANLKTISTPQPKIEPAQEPTNGLKIDSPINQ